MVTPISLQESLTEFLKINVAEKIKVKSTMENSDNVHYKHPQVVLGFVLPKISDKRRTTKDEDGEYPFIATRVTGYKNRDVYSSVVNIKIIFGVHCYGSYKGNILLEDASGYRDILNIAEKIRQELFKMRILDKKYEILDDFKVAIPDEQPYPYWVGEMETNWIISNLIN